MKKLLLTSAAFIALGATSYAADLPAPMAAVEPMPVVAAYSWTGFYLGAHAGYGWGDRDFDADELPFGLDEDDFNDDFPFEYDLDGFLAGAQVGFNWQWNWLLLGAEADASWTHADQEISYDLDFGPFDDGDVDDLSADADLQWLASIRARAGFAVDRFLVYGTAGWAFAEVDLDVSLTDDGGACGFAGGCNSDGGSESYNGLVLGVGLEAMITQHITARIEYLHYDLGSEDVEYDLIGGGGVDDTFGEADLNLNVVRAGVNWKF
jgi:outer membrane immunogenic protein